MIISLLLFIFIGSILAYNPNAGKLKETNKITLKSKIYLQKGTFLLGSLLILVYGFSIDGTSYVVSDDILLGLGLSYIGVIEQGDFYQPLTSIFIHLDLIHLCGNLLVLALLSAYERRIGTQRFFVIFFISSLIASFSDLLYIDRNTVSAGASAGICGLAAGYFVDYPQTSWKEWATGSFLVLVIVIFDAFLSNRNNITAFEMNWTSHLVGAIIAAIFIRMRPLSVKAISL